MAPKITVAVMAISSLLFSTPLASSESVIDDLAGDKIDERTAAYIKLAQEQSRDTVLVAEDYLGLNERRDRRELREFIGIDPVRYEWCAAFANAVLRELGEPGSDSVSPVPLTARSFLRWGERVKIPERGDVMVFTRGRSSWKGHVGFFVKTETVNGITYWVIISGNSNQAVSYKSYPVNTRQLLGIRRMRPKTQPVTTTITVNRYRDYLETVVI